MNVHRGGRAVAEISMDGFAPPDAAAVKTFSPTTFPSTQDPTDATPDAFVDVDAPVTSPPPAFAVNVTAIPVIGFPL
ncbi:MAG TPA: hypothetical protein VM166_11565 [Gemmatimonadaceae bacterium]|nr:hypothetical protein [Gemmatimonadaceae bacterium]